jgi:glycosyltransferase involved in cell wall biosynthesis
MIILSHPTGNTFSAAIVDALYEEEMLAAFYTCIVWSPDTPLAKMLPARIRTILGRRSRVQLPSKWVHTRPFREAIRNICITAGKKQWIASESNPFSTTAVYRDMDVYIARSLSKYPGARGIYAYEDGAVHEFREAKKRGIHCFYDLPIGYWRANKELSKLEAELKPEWKGTLGSLADSEAKCAIKDEELSLADTIVVPSNFVKTTLNLFPGKTRVVVNPFGLPANISPPRELTGKDKPLRVIYVGSLTQRKGIAYLFEAVDKLGSAVSLTLVGRKSGESELRDKYIEKYNWIPSLPHSEILAEMQRHDVFVFPSLFEGLALVQGEAISQGLPVITTPNSGGTDILRPGIDSFVVPIRDPDAIAERLMELHQDRALLQQMSDAARERASQLGWQGYKQRTVALIREALS